MPTLKEIKGRIGSVKSTLKITSAMKLVSSAKLRKAQTATEAMRPYQAQLQRMLALVSDASRTVSANLVLEGAENALSSTDQGVLVREAAKGAVPTVMDGPDLPSPTAIVAVASNSSLCGGFNANVIAKVRSVRKPGDVVVSIGRKMADAMRKDGFPSPADFSSLAEHPAYAPAAELVERLAHDLKEGRIGQVLLVYTHFVSTARQVPVVETLLAAKELPSEAPSVIPSEALSVIPSEAEGSTHIFEPSAKELRALLLPKTLKLKLYSALLDSAAAEHAARTVAMQTATDNGNDLLEELTLQYNKGRQQKITNEILDLAGGQQD